MVAAVAVVMTIGPSFAQDDEWRISENPYQADLEYTIGESFSPRVEIESLRWRSFKIDSVDGQGVVAGEDVDVEIALEFENRGRKSVKVLVILLLENEDGTPLDRIEVKTFKVSADRLKERTETTTLRGDVLLSTRRVYAFCEVLK